MNVMINDAVFGEMTYTHRWSKKESFSFFGKNWDITVVAKAFSGNPISAACFLSMVERKPGTNR